MTAFSSQLRRLRKEKGLTQEQLSAVLHVTRQTISNWENDRAQPDYDMLSVIAEVFDVPLSVLLGEEAAPVPAAQTEPTPGESPPDLPPEPPPELPVVSQQETAPESEARPLPKKRIAFSLLAVLCVLGLAAALASLHARPTAAAFALEQFTCAAAPVQGAAHLHIYTREDSARYIQARPEATPKWNVRFFMQENAGVGLDFDMLTTVLFFADGSQRVNALTQAQFKDTIGHPHIAPREMRIFTFDTVASDDILGVGLEVQATDDSGNPLVFTHYQPLEYVPR